MGNIQIQNIMTTTPAMANTEPVQKMDKDIIQITKSKRLKTHRIGQRK